VLYLGEINDSQREVWTETIEAVDETHQVQRRLALFPSDREIPEHARDVGVQVRLSRFRHLILCVRQGAFDAPSQAQMAVASIEGKRAGVAQCTGDDLQGRLRESAEVCPA